MTGHNEEKRRDDVVRGLPLREHPTWQKDTTSQEYYSLDVSYFRALSLFEKRAASIPYIYRLNKNVRMMSLLYMQFKNLINDFETAEISRNTMSRADDFLHTIAELADDIDVDIEFPRISLAEESSIDLYWELEGLDLLVNIDNDPEVGFSFYQKDQSGESQGNYKRFEQQFDILRWIRKK